MPDRKVQLLGNYTVREALKFRGQDTKFMPAGALGFLFFSINRYDRLKLIGRQTVFRGQLLD